MHDNTYTSFLLRFWHADGNQSGGWCGEIEHIQSGESQSFATLDEALRWLRSTIDRVQTGRSDPLDPQG